MTTKSNFVSNFAVPLQGIPYAEYSCAKNIIFIEMIKLTGSPGFKRFRFGLPFFVFLFVVAGSVAFAQIKPELPISDEEKPKKMVPDINRSLNWLTGTWKGPGIQRGQTFTSILSVKPSLDGQALIFERSSQFGYKELFILGYEQPTKKFVAALFNNRNRSAVFICEVEGRELRLTQVTDSEATSRRIFSLQGDGTMRFTVEQGNTGGEMKKLTEITFKKTA